MFPMYFYYETCWNVIVRLRFHKKPNLAPRNPLWCSPATAVTANHPVCFGINVSAHAFSPTFFTKMLHYSKFLINHNLCTLFAKFHKVGGIHIFSMCIWGLLLLGTFRRWSCTKSTNSSNAQKVHVPQHLFILSCFTFPNGHILSQV